MTRVRPKKALGQHFLVDRNVLGVIERLAGLAPTDVVLEVGPGLGVLTTFLADRVQHVHAVELDRSLDGELRAVLADRSNVAVVFADAMAVDIGLLDPPPMKLVANLPYNVATPLVAESLTAGGPIESWCVMVQREVAERFFAQPGTKAYGAVSVLVRLHARRTGFHPVSRTVFRPPPNVDSALVAFERIPAPADAGRVLRIVSGIVRAPPEDPGKRAGARRRRATRGGRRGARRHRSRSRRPRGSPPARGVRPARGSPPGMSEWRTRDAPAKLNLALVVGPRRADGKHEVVTILERLSLRDTVAVRRAAKPPR